MIFLPRIFRTNCLCRYISTSIPKHSSSPVDLSYTIHGSSPSPESVPIIVIHGLLGSKRNWKSVSQAISKETGRTVIAVDMRNHGESPHVDSHTYRDLAGDVEHLMRRFGVANGVLIGHSMGGRTAMVLSLLKPEKVASLIAVDISPASTARSLTSDYFPNLMDSMKNANFDKVSSVAEAKIIVKEALKAIDNEDAVDFILLNLYMTKDKKIKWRINVEVLKKYYRTDIATFPNDLVGKKYSGPSLFIGGSRSDFMPPSETSKIREYFPEAEIEIIDGAGHNVHADKPEEFTAVVVEFLSRLNK